MLKGFRLLDLTDEKGALCGKMFADLGAEVIKVEPPGGCSTRRIPPYLEDKADADHCLYSIAYHAGKKSVTANLDTDDGRALVADLAAKSDFLVESHPLGYLDSIGLGYDALAKKNPRLIYASITPFGDTGPGKDYNWADIITWAAGGMMYLMGEEGKPPLQMSLPQAGLHAGGEAAVAMMLAHYPRQTDGLGQRIVVNMQACIVWTLMNEQAMPFLHGNHLSRTGIFVGSADARRKMVYECKDGHISILITGGTTFGNSTKALIEWMRENGFGSDWMRTKDWISWMPGMFMKHDRAGSRADRRSRRPPSSAFFMTMTKRRDLRAGTEAPHLSRAGRDRSRHRRRRAAQGARLLDLRSPHDTLGRTLTISGAVRETVARRRSDRPRARRESASIATRFMASCSASAPERLNELRATGSI